MRMIKEAKESESYSRKVTSTRGVVVVPAFVGLGAPYWDNECRGAVFGLTRATKKEHFIRATLESIALQTKDVIKTMEKETNIHISTLKVDGGATANSYLMQYQSDILSSEVLLPNCLETTALGAAYLAGLQTGFWKDIEDIKSVHKYQRLYKPNMKKSEIKIIDKRWKTAIKATRMFK